MDITRETALEKLYEWTEGNALRIHARLVEIAMRAAALQYGDEGDVEEWGVAGLLHDADYEKWPEDHPDRIVAWLRERGEEKMAHAISAHATMFNIPYDTQLDKALLACDELSGFIGACCFVRPDGIHTLTPKSVKKKLKDKSFAAKVNRDEIKAGLEMIGADLTEHIQLLIDAFKPHADELGINGRG